MTNYECHLLINELTLNYHFSRSKQGERLDGNWLECNYIKIYFLNFKTI